MSKGQCNNTDINYTDYSNTYPFLSGEVAPDVVVTFLVGQKQSTFFEQWKAVRDENIEIVTTTSITQEYMHLTCAEGTMKNVYFSAPYAEELETPASRRWKNSIRARFNQSQIPYLGSDHEAAYLAIMLYKKAVEICGSTETEAVIHGYMHWKQVFHWRPRVDTVD